MLEPDNTITRQIHTTKPNELIVFGHSGGDGLF